VPILITWTNRNEVFYKSIFHEYDIITTILTEFKTNINYYAHNLLFDFSFFFNNLEQLQIKYSWVFIDFRLFGIKIYKSNTEIIYLKCSYKLLPIALKKMYPHLTNNPKLIINYTLLTN
jgi:hypothetical protein